MALDSSRPAVARLVTDLRDLWSTLDAADSACEGAHCDQGPPDTLAHRSIPRDLVPCVSNRLAAAFVRPPQLGGVSGQPDETAE